MPYLHASKLHVCTYKGKQKKPANKQWKEKMQRAYKRGIKQISVIDMASKETRKLVNKRTRKKTNKQKGKQKDGVHEGLM